MPLTRPSLGSGHPLPAALRLRGEGRACGTVAPKIPGTLNVASLAPRDFAAAAARRRVRRAMSGHVEVARQQIRQLRGRGDARRIAPTARAAVDVLVVRALDRVGA